MENTITFNQFSLPLPMQEALSRMQFITPTPVQEKTIPQALEGQDILGTAQTGTGKTGAFGIPLLASIFEGRKRQALILSPTRELAAQIHQVLRKLGKEMRMNGALVVGGESFNRQVSELSRGVDYVVATPGRLNDHLQEGTIDLRSVDVLVLDEVDRLLDMGFAPQIRTIVPRLPHARQTMLFSATLPKEVMNLAGTLLKNPIRIEIDAVTRPAALVDQQTIRTSADGKNGVLLKAVEERQGKILIFTRTKSRTDRLARLLDQKGHAVALLHGGRSQSQRRFALDRFRNGSRRILVATDLAGRGIDVPDIEHVINYDLPATRDEYIHRIGRTGRCGKTGKALNLILQGDSDGERVLRSDGPAPRGPQRPQRGFRPRRSPGQGQRRNHRSRW